MKLDEAPSAVVHRLASSQKLKNKSTMEQPSEGSNERWGRDGTECRNCIRRHPKNKCWTADKPCNACGDEGHLAKCCNKYKRSVHYLCGEGGQSGTIGKPSQSDQAVNAMSTSDLSADYFIIDALVWIKTLRVVRVFPTRRYESEVQA